ncbi:MAG: flagellar filament capping protein FliD [Sphingomonadaceae bacterium]
METTSTTRSATQGLVAALGAGSGIDMAALASDLAAAQFAGRIDRLSAKSETLEARISAASDLKGMLLSLSTSLGERIRVGDLSPQPRVANGAVAQASLSGTRQPTGSYSLEVTQLASSQTLASAPYTAATDPTGAGTLTLRFGTVAGGSFTEDTASTAVDITIAPGATLADVAAAINGADSGVTAYVAQTVDGAQLVLKGEQGANSGFILEATEDAGEPGLANLAWSPGSANGTLLTTAVDALFEVDGLEMSSASNTVVDAIPGVKLELAATNTGAPTTVTFADPSDAIGGAMRDLTTALNEIASVLREATDAQTGELARDSGARRLRSSFGALAGTVIMPTAAETAPRTMADLGLKTGRDGTFELDTKRLSETLARDPEGAAEMFTTGLYGIYATIDGISRAASTPGDPGSLTGSINRYTNELREIGEDQAELAEKQEDVRARLVARFAVSESRIGASQATLSFLQNQIAAWNAKD